MKQEILTRFPWPCLPTLALLLFFSFFVLLLFRVNSKKQKAEFELAGTLPLGDGKKYE
jgi:cbb3-type cytochrome oxidase subunit 3